MNQIDSPFVDRFLRSLAARCPGEPEFHRSVRDLLISLEPVLDRRHAYREQAILERLVEPERAVLFRVPWIDDAGRVQINTGYRVEFSSALGPCSGGIRFHSTVNLGVFKFLAFEQVFRNSLTTLPLGGAHGGSDFDPKGRSDNEVMRFCQSFMTGLARHLGPHTDVLTGDIGVGGREIGFLFGQYKRLRNRFDAVTANKAVPWGGSLLRPEATGYGVAYFAEQMLSATGGLDGKRVAISGSGDVALAAAQKSLELGAAVVSLSDSRGFIIAERGLDSEVLDEVIRVKTMHRGPLSDVLESTREVEYREGSGVWSTPCDVAMPCAAHNDLGADDTEVLLCNGCRCVVEGATMPMTPEAAALIAAHGALVGPGKAATAGGAVVSALELSQNAARLPWSRKEVDRRLREVMTRIHDSCLAAAADQGVPGDLVAGANIAAFVRVADAMIDQGLV